MEEHMKILFIILSFGLFTFGGVAEWKTQPDGQKTKRHSDGRFEVRYPNGNVNIVHKDHIESRYPDGRLIIRNLNGSVRTKGTWKTENAKSKSNKNILYSLPKSERYSGPVSRGMSGGGGPSYSGPVSRGMSGGGGPSYSGPVSRGMSGGGGLSSGRGVSSLSGGSSNLPGKSLTIIDVKKHTNGDITTKYSDGRIETDDSLGTTVEYPDGREVRFDRGERVIVTRYPDGRKKIQYSKGSFRIEHPDGRVEKGYAQSRFHIGSPMGKKNLLKFERDKWKKEAELYKNDYLKCKRSLARYTAPKATPPLKSQPVSASGLGVWAQGPKLAPPQTMSATGGGAIQ